MTLAETTVQQEATDAPRLRLRKLVVEGFKSFADKVEFAFDAPIVGIVGPNGCGKSNVVDAIKWVLGEQSAKSLRGGAMLDVIFNGAAGRPAGNAAEVTLVFENPGADDGSRRLAIDSDTVSVGRILLRDGTSHYKLNGKNARLKDVRELFLDTGVGVDAYSVIEQGRVAQMLDANPSDRRAIFEEAAGVSRFKLQAKEAGQKLDRTETNLDRLSDVLEELERRLRSVKLAAGKARSYQELVARLESLRLKAALHEYHTLVTRQREQTAAREDAAFDADDAAGDLRKAEGDLSARRADTDRAEEAKRQAEYTRVQAESKREQAQQQIAYADRQAAQLDQQEARLEADAVEAQRQRDALAASVGEDEAALAEATAALDALTAEREEKHAAHRDAQLRQAEAARKIENAKTGVLSATNAIAAADRRLGGLDSQLRSTSERHQSLVDRAKTLEADAADADSLVDDLTRRRDTLAADKAQQETAVAERRDAAAALGQQLSDIGERLAVARETRADLASRRNVLADLEQRREGIGEGVAEVLRDRETRFPYVRGLVADLIDVDVEHAAVVEAALDGRDRWLVCDDGFDLEAAARDLSDLPERVTLIPTTPRLPSRVGSNHERETATNVSGVAAELAPRVRSGNPTRGASSAATPDADTIVRISNFVRCDDEHSQLIDHLLSDTRLVAGVAEAGSLKVRCVTRAGEIVNPDGSLRAGQSGTAASGLISRRSELADVAVRLESIDRDIADLQADLTRSGEASKQLDAEVNALRERVYETNTKQVETAEKLSAAEDRKAALSRELPSVRQEVRDLEATADRLSAEREALEEKRATAQSQREAFEAEQAEQSRGQDELVKAVAEAAEALTSLRVETGQAQEKQLAARRSLDRHAARRRELTEQADRVTEAAAELHARREELASERGQHEADVRRLASQVEEAAARTTELAEKASKLRAGIAELAEAVDAAQSRKDAAEDAARNADAQLAEIALRLENTLRRYADEAEMNVAAEYDQRLGDDGSFAEEDENWDAVTAEVRDLRGKISRLGSVNVEAITELEDLETRRDTLAAQLDDLRESRQGLLDLIETLNKESGERFAQTFEAVRGHFNGMFRKLFGGGRADLTLQTEIVERRRNDEGQLVSHARTLDPLEAGIEIVARPPGKQPVHLSQLSGGEKTMTCVALLMSIFKSKPSPFCVLDEVDAALDEANNSRFNAIIEDFLGESQFIVITHSKTTMRIADVLYGVTMQDQGVSKKVSVRFDQIERDGRIRK